MSWALVGAATAGGAAFFAVRLGGAGLAAALPSVAGAACAGGAVAVAASNVARSRRATGASMVLDADLTYSPNS
jgi:hypothetical protein